jgi:hypothetical protein
MTTTKNTARDVTLEKSSTGTWTVPEKPKRQIRPWQRLWLVSGIIYLLLLIVSYFMLVPNLERIERKMVFSVTEEVRRYDGLAFAGESPRNIFKIARSQGYDQWIASVRSAYRIGPEGNAGFDKVEQAYHDAITDLPLKRSLGIMICFVAWLMPMSALYVIGLVIDWIKRGTRAIGGK